VPDGTHDITFVLLQNIDVSGQSAHELEVRSFMRTQVRRILSGSSSHLSMLRRSSGVRPSSPRSAGVLETWWKRLVPSISRVSKLAPVDFAGAPRPVGPAVAIELPYTLPEAYVSRNGRTKFNTVAESVR
jgi:hypothetical protein